MGVRGLGLKAAASVGFVLEYAEMIWRGGGFSGKIGREVEIGDEGFGGDVGLAWKIWEGGEQARRDLEGLWD